MADVPSASSFRGLDSSLIVALLAERGQSGLTTFSIGFEEPAAARETSSPGRTWSRSAMDRPPAHPDRDERLLPALTGDPLHE